MTRLLFISTKNRWFYRLTMLTFTLTFALITLGIFSRVGSNGMHCQHWPLCVGAKTLIESLVLPAEMVHRYLTVVDMLFIFILTVAAPFFRKQFTSKPLMICLLLLPLACIQILLCKLTAAAQTQPIMILSHLIVGLSTLCLLWFLSRVTSPNTLLVTHPSTRSIRPWAWLALGLLATQIILSAWIPANFGTLVCDNFPYCHGQLLPVVNSHTVVALTKPTQKPDANTLLNLQLLDRAGMVLTAVYLGLFCMLLMFNRHLYQTAFFIILFLAAEISLNIFNMAWQYPVKTVISYEVITVFLLLSVVTLLTNLYRKSQDYWYG